jgi:hypothetical protein
VTLVRYIVTSSSDKIYGMRDFGNGICQEEIYGTRDFGSRR